MEPRNLKGKASSRGKTESSNYINMKSEKLFGSIQEKDHQYNFRAKISVILEGSSATFSLKSIVKKNNKDDNLALQSGYLWGFIRTSNNKKQT